MSDPVQTLGTLFQGTIVLRCEDAADSNGDGAIDITDAVYTLQWLFAGAPPPAPPFAEPGGDPTEDGLECGTGL